MKSIDIKSKRVADTYEYTFKDGTYSILLDKRGIPFGLEKPMEAIYLFDTITHKGKDITVLAFIGGDYPYIIAGDHGVLSFLNLNEGELNIDSLKENDAFSSTNADYNNATYEAPRDLYELAFGEVSEGCKLEVLWNDYITRKENKDAKE